MKANLIITAEKGEKELRRDDLLCESPWSLVLCGKKRVCRVNVKEKP